MNRQFTLTEDAIRAALTPAPQVQAPFDLAESIRTAVDATPQRRRPWAGVLPPRVGASVRMFVLVAIVGLLLLIGLLLAVGSRRPVLPALVSDVAMYHGGPDRTGVVAGPGPIARPAIAWQASVGGPIVGNMPAVVAGVVYVADGGGGVEAYGAETGDVRWKVSLGNPANTSPAVGGGLLVVGDAAGEVVALDIRDGSRRWIFPTGGEVRSSAAIVDGIVYVGSADGNLYALNLATGAKRWAFDAGGAVTRSPAVDAGIVYVGAAGGTFSAVDTTSGRLRWQKGLGPGQIASPAVGNGLVVAANGLDDLTAPHILFVLDALSGDVRQRFSAPPGQLLVIAALVNGSVFAAGGDGNVYAVDSGTGALLWTFDGHGSLGSQHESVDALAGAMLYVAGGDRAVYAVDVHTGAQVWRQGVTGQPDGIAVVGDRAYIGTDLGKVVAIGGVH
jgi:outer membrane protein assembly factor BamB